MHILLRAGEYLWSERGAHVCDDNGFATMLDQDTEVTFDEDVAASALAFIKADREFRGVDPETGLPLPEPEVVPEETPVTEEVPNA